MSGAVKKPPNFRMPLNFRMYRAERTRPGIRPLGGVPAAPAGQARWQRGGGDGPSTPPSPPAGAPAKVPEIGGPQGPEPTRYGDWERNGICYDF